MLFDLDEVRLGSIYKKKTALDNLIKENKKIFDELISKWFRTETTYSSNAIEGNTLSKLQTEIVINHKTTVAGKTIIEHLEAVNHAEAYDFILSLLGTKNISEHDILDIHRLILQNIDNDNAGRYRSIPVRISGSSTILPNHTKISSLMEQLVESINASDSALYKALLSHYQLVTIHPFIDGNGRTARLLMNYFLMNDNYPPAIIKKSDRIRYLQSLETGQTKNIYEEYVNLMLKSIERSIDFCLSHYNENYHKHNNLVNKKIRIGELSKQIKVPVSTIRHWVNMGIILPSETTDAGHYLFTQRDVDICRSILDLQRQKMTLNEILVIMRDKWQI